MQIYINVIRLLFKLLIMGKLCVCCYAPTSRAPNFDFGVFHSDLMVSAPWYTSIKQQAIDISMQTIIAKSARKNGD